MISMRLFCSYAPIVLAALTLTSTASARDEQKCDLHLINQTLGKRLKVAIKDDDSGKKSDEVIALVCKLHPVETAWTVVALFQDLPIVAPGTAAEVTSVLFVLAFVDRATKRIVSWHQKVMEADAVTRFDAYSLRIDTAHYALAPLVRAVGVRMNTFVSRCSHDGGYSDELSLFVQRGPRLEPVLSSMPMSVWQIRVLSGNSCGDMANVKKATHNADLSLSISPSSTHGFADIAVRAKTRTELEGERWEQAGRKAPALKEVTVQLGTLQFNGKGYDGAAQVSEAVRQLHERRMRLVEKVK